MLYENIKKGADIKIEYGSNTTATAVLLILRAHMRDTSKRNLIITLILNM